MNAINLADKLSTFSEHYKARTEAQFADDEAHLLLIESPGTPKNGDRSTAAQRIVI